MKKLILTFVFFLILFGSVILQEQEQISSKKSELAKIKDEISGLEEELKLKTAKEKESYSVLENYSKQSFLLNKVINSVKAEEQQKEIQINKRKNEISSLEKKIEGLQKNYAKYVVAVYKYGQVDEITSIVNAKSIEQAVLRYKYFQKFSEQRESDVKEIKTNRDNLISAKEMLEKERKEKEQLAELKQKEEAALRVKLNERKSILSSIKNDKDELKKELISKKNAESKISGMITKLIEEAERKRREEAERIARIERERIEKERLAAANRAVEKGEAAAVIEEKIDERKIEREAEYNLDLSTKNFASFSALKGRMIWPLLGGKIVRRYGENKNVQLKTVTLNYGVDISAGKDLNVKAVGEGVVSAIDWIAGYGSVIIITHKDDFRTVYSHLSEIFVKEGDKVKMGKVIAKVGESLEGNILHFEIWNSRSNQNPEVWLAKK